jgi:hypothetical protein
MNARRHAPLVCAPLDAVERFVDPAACRISEFKELLA